MKDGWFGANRFIEDIHQVDPMYVIVSMPETFF